MSPQSSHANGNAPASSGTVADQLRRRIRAGDLPPGAKLPTQQQLAEEFQVNRTVVRHALTMLEDEELIVGGRGAPATVAERRNDPAGAEEPRPANIELAAALYEAFKARHVTIDAFSLTTETLTQALAPALLDVAKGTLHPESITARVLLPLPDARLADPSAPPDDEEQTEKGQGALPDHAPRPPETLLALPRPVDGTQDPLPALKRLRDLQQTHAKSLVAQFEGAQNRGLIADISVEIRGIPVTPTHKLYVLNGTEAYHCYYEVIENRVRLGRKEVEIYDVLGVDIKLFHASTTRDQGSGQEASFVEQSRTWFESLWTRIAQPFPLD